MLKGGNECTPLPNRNARSLKDCLSCVLAFFLLLPILLYLPEILNGKSIISGDGMAGLFSEDALRKSLLQGESLCGPRILGAVCHLLNWIITSILPFIFSVPFCHSYSGFQFIWGCIMQLPLLRCFCYCVNWVAKGPSVFLWPSFTYSQFIWGCKKRALELDCCQHICSPCHAVASEICEIREIDASAGFISLHDASILYRLHAVYCICRPVLFGILALYGDQPEESGQSVDGAYYTVGKHLSHVDLCASASDTFDDPAAIYFRCRKIDGL